MAGRKAGRKNEGQKMNCRETHQAGHDAGQHSKRKPQDVEEGQGHEGLLGIQDMGVVNEDIGCEGCLRGEVSSENRNLFVLIVYSPNGPSASPRKDT